MSLDLSETQSILKGIVRSIEKRADFSAELAERDQRAVVLVNLSHRSKSTAVQIPMADVEASRLDLRRRHQVRTLLKKRFDAMLFVAPPNHMKKFAQSSGDGGGGQYRSSGGRGRR